MAEVEFRTGKREIPDYLATMMSGLDTTTMTYEEAIDRANRRLETDRANKAVDDAVRSHLKGLGLGR